MDSHQSKASGTNESNENSPPQTPNRRSAVWDYFQTELVEEDGVLKAVCKYCGAKLISRRKSGTNSLRSHIAEYCSKIPSEDRSKFLATMKKKPLDGLFTFDPKRSRELMIAWCIRAEVAFNKFDDPSFEPWMESMQPTFKCVGRQTIRNDCVSMFERAKNELRIELQSLDSHICFTTDLWTSNQKLGYLCLTAHYIDSDFVLKKKIIAFKDVKYPHNGIVIEEAITKCLTDYGIKEKMFTITLDNAANNKTACNLLQESGKSDLLFGGEHLLVRCCAHILNILVQDGLNVTSDAIELIRDLARHVNSSPSRIQAFNEIAERENLDKKASLVLDVPNRWNSTYYMICEAVKYKSVFKQYANSFQQPFPTDYEWTQADSIGEFLGVFEETTRTFSSDRFPTSHQFLDSVLCIQQSLRSQEWHKDQVIKDLARAMDKKFDKYWDGNYNMTLVISTILDPRQKTDFLEFFYEKVCENFIGIDPCKDLAKDWLLKYVRKYEESIRRYDMDAVPHESRCRNMVNRSPVLLVGKRKIHREFVQFKSQKRGSRIEKSEVDAYLEEESVRDDENFEILTWWKTNSNKYPVLSAMARDFLAIPLSTVSSESAFSLGGRILSDSRSSMTPQTLEALVCCKDWMYKYPSNEVQEGVREV